MPKTYTFIVSDENVLNSYGFRVMTDGIDLSQFEKNPLVLWMHKRPGRRSDENNKETEVFPIGKVVSLSKDIGRLIADIEFDQDDEFARKIEQKVENGIIRMTSPGLEPVALSDEDEYLLPGQTGMTLTKSTLHEISIVDLGSNPNALRLALYNTENKLVTLSKDNVGSYIPPLSKPTTQQKNSNTNIKTNIDMDFTKQVAVMLAMNPEASQETLLKALKDKLELASQAESIKLKHDDLVKQVKQMNDNVITTLVDANIDKKFTADKRDELIKLGKESGLETLKSVVDMMPDMVKPSDVITLSSNGRNAKIEKFDDLIKLGADAVEKFRNDNRSEYIRLYKEKQSKMKKILTLITGLFFVAVMAVTASFAIGVPVTYTGPAVLAISVIQSAVLPFMAPGVNLFAGVLKELWTGELINKFRHDGSFMSRIPSANQYVNNDAIHLAEIGADPDVLINNNTYPIGSVTRDDDDVVIALDKYDTVNTKILQTTGADNGSGRGRLVAADIIALKKKFDTLKIPRKNRLLVLCADHVEDLLLASESFEKNYVNKDVVTGRIMNMYGFEVYEEVYNPVYDNTTGQKKAYGAAASPTNDQNASVAFYAGRSVKATGSVKMYNRKAADDPENRATTVGFRLYHVAFPKTKTGFGSIRSAVV